jgi:hypothetical protein
MTESPASYTHVGLPTYNTLMLEVMMSSKNEYVIIHDLTKLNLLIIFNAWWNSMNAGSKLPIAWNRS